MNVLTILPAICLSISAVAAMPTAATAQVRMQDMHTARADNLSRTDALKTRISTVQARVAEGRRNGKLTPSRAAQLTRRIARLHETMGWLNHKQGFVSAAELASFNRALGEMDVALDGYGVPRSYGNDGRIAPNRAK